MSLDETSGAKHEPVITIRGERVGLGPLRRDLLDTLHLRWGNDLAAGLMQGAVGFATSESNRRFFEHRTGTPGIEELLVYELSTLRPIGTTNLHDMDIADRNVELAWNIMEHDCRGKGYGTEAARLTIDYAFTAVGMHRVHVAVYEYNEPSLRMARKLGFTEYGRARKVHWAGNRYWDMLLFDLLADEFTSPVLARELPFLGIDRDG